MDGVRARARADVRAHGRVRVRGRGRDRRPKTHRSGMIRPMGGVRISGPADRHDRPSMPPQIEHIHPPVSM